MNYKTEPLPWQRFSFDYTKDLPYAGLFLEQGLGKSKVTIDTMDYLVDNGEINAMVILAPNGVHSNWVLREISKHSRYAEKAEMRIWNANRFRTKSGQKDMSVFDSCDRNLKILAVNIETLAVEKARHYVEVFTQKHMALCVVDESTVIKNPNAKRTRAAIKIGQRAKYRRILSGTPITEGVENLWPQCYFLSSEALPYRSYVSFKAAHCIENRVQINTGAQFTKIVGYRNLDQLKEMIKPFSVRLVKEECADLPEKRYNEIVYEMPPASQKLYNQVKNDCMGELKELGVQVTVTDVLAAMTRLSQIACGFVKNDDETITTLNTDREDIILSHIETLGDSEKVVLWVRYLHSLQVLSGMLVKRYGPGSVVQYYGAVDDKKRQENIDHFQNDKSCRFFVANRTASRGLTLTSASQVIYHSNEFSLETRLQSEDRVHRIGQDKPVYYIDIMAHGTIDLQIQKALVSKQEISDSVLLGWEQFFKG